MLCFTVRVRVLLLGSFLLIYGPAAEAAKPSESLLPKTTKGFLSVPDVDKFRASWDKTQLGQLAADPVMQPFVESLKRQIKHQWSQQHEELGLTWEDLDGVPGGELSVAAIENADGQTALAILVDVTGHAQQADALLEKVSKNLTSQQARKSRQDVYETSIIVFDIPKKEDRPARQAVYFLKDNVLGASDNLAVVEGILGRWSSGKDNLAGVPAFEYIMKRCGSAAGDLAPSARWFVEPFGMAEFVRKNNPDRQRRKGTDLLKILRTEGFTAIQGIGGYVNFMVGKYELLHRTAVYAPAVKTGPDKYELSARMLDLPNKGSFDPPSWVPREVATYASFNWNMAKAFEASKTLVNKVVGDEVFEDVLKSIEEDPNGPEINIRRDLIAHLGTRATMISDYQLPITPKSERVLFAAETTNENQLRLTIEKSMKTDPDARRREFGKHVIWEIVDEPTELPMVTIEVAPELGATTKGADDEEPEERHKLPNSAVAVAYGHLFIATHVDFLAKILTQADEQERLAQSTDFRLVQAELGKLLPGEHCARQFSRTDEEYRPVYELLRTGRMPQAETLLGKILNSLLGTGKEGVPRAQRIDGSKLPDYETVRRYFGPAGLIVTTEEKGWFLSGLTLSKEK